MSNTVLLKKSSVSSKVPLTTDLSYGEVALNYADGKLYYKTSGNTIDYLPSAAATATLTNKTLTSPTLNGTTTLAGSEVLITAGSGGNEGGELHFQTPATGSTLSGPIAIDIYQNKIRIFETTGTNRGVYIDITSAGAGVGTNLLTGGSGSAIPTSYSNYDEFGVSAVSTSTTVYSFATSTYRSAKYFISVTNGTNYGTYEFIVTHDGTNIYFSGDSRDYVTSPSGTSVSYFAGDYVEELGNSSSRIEVGTMGHSFNWTISAGNLIFSAASTTGTISVKGLVNLIKV